MRKRHIKISPCTIVSPWSSQQRRKATRSPHSIATRADAKSCARIKIEVLRLTSKTKSTSTISDSSGTSPPGITGRIAEDPHRQVGSVNFIPSARKSFVEEFRELASHKIARHTKKSSRRTSFFCALAKYQDTDLKVQRRLPLTRLLGDRVLGGRTWYSRRPRT